MAITIEIFGKYDWQSVFTEARKPECHYYVSPFVARIQNAIESGDKEAEELYKLLHQIALLNFEHSDPPTETLQPGFKNGSQRSFLPQDLTIEECNVLVQIAPDVRNAGFRARLLHVVWIRNRSFQAALDASSAYLEYAKEHEDPGDWVYFIDHLWLAYLIARRLGSTGAARAKEVISYAESLIDPWSNIDTGFGLLKLVEILIKGDSALLGKCAKICDFIADRDKDNPSLAREYWNTAAQCYRKLGNFDTSNIRRIEAAETYVKEASSRISGDNPSFLAASMFIEHAITALRRIEGCSDRAKELVKLYKDYSLQARSEMKPIVIKQDISSHVEEVRSKIRAMSLGDAIGAMSLGVNLSNRDSIRAQAIKQIVEYPISHIFAANLTDSNGRIVAKRPGAIRESDAGWGIALEAETRTLWTMEVGLRLSIYIVPAIQEITLRHLITEEQIRQITIHNPFIPPGHEPLFTKGLLYGFQFKFAEAAHILVPQLENSVRYILEQHNITTISHTDEGIQDVKTLDVLLRDDPYKSKLVEILGDNCLFDLEGLLVSRFGFNYRNCLAHGLIGYAQAAGNAAVLTWWHVLRLCLIPLLNEESAAYDEGVELPTFSEESDLPEE